MPIYIRDETANALVLTIDNNGNMAFADGTPINMLTLGGYGIIDSNGYIVHGLGSNSVTPASGSARVSVSSFATITTISGRTPTVQIDTSAPAIQHTLVSDPGNPDAPPTHTETVIGGPVHKVASYPGAFRIGSMTTALDGRLLDPGSDYYDAELAQGIDVSYRWL
jgi:hypothetical protein